MHRWLAGTDGPGRSALPLGEFLHPAPLAALAVLAVNDHVLKGSGWLPGWLTGKLSDFAGLLFFPLLVTAAGDTVAWAAARVTRLRLDFSLRRWKLALAIVVTGAAFAGLELSDAWGRFYVDTLGRLGFPSQTTRDPTDLAALVMLWPAWRRGVAEIRRVPLGRFEVVARARVTDIDAVRAAFDDVRALHPWPPAIDALASHYASWLATRSPTAAAATTSLLETLRGRF